MNPTPSWVGAIALAMAAASFPHSAPAQSSPLLAPADPHHASAAIQYESPLAGFRAFDTRKAASWARSNETAGAVGGHAGALGGPAGAAPHAGHGAGGAEGAAPAPAAVPVSPVDREGTPGPAPHHHGGGT